MPDRLYDRAADIALLHRLMHRRDWHEGPDLVHWALEWLGWNAQPRATVKPLAVGMNATLRGWFERGIVEKRPASVTRRGVEWRLNASLTMGDIKRLTGGIDPLRASSEECAELDQPNVAGMRRVQFDPEAYLRAHHEHERRARAIWQCPSPFELGRRLKTINRSTT